MNRFRATITLFPILLLLTGLCLGQSGPAKAPPASYRLSIVLSEVEGGKATNQRAFQMVVMADSWGELRAGTRVPVVTSPGAGKEGPPQIVYMDIGFSAQARVIERESRQYLEMEINVSNPISAEGAQTPAGNPVLRNVRQKVSTLVENKPILVASMDDMNSKKTFQVEVTAVRLN
jgi:hypothetical protein